MNKTDLIRSTLLAAALSLALTGCAGDPSAGAPKAEVSEIKAAVAAPTAPEAAQAKPGPAAPVEGLMPWVEGSKVTAVGAKVTGKHIVTFPLSDGGLSVVDGVPTVVTGTIDMNGLQADKARLTRHLRSPDFFDAPGNPTSSFEARSFTMTDAGFDVEGSLTLMGKTKAVKFPATFAETDGAWTMKAEFGINRQDWGISYPGKPDDLIRDEVLIQLALVAKAR